MTLPVNLTEERTPNINRDPSEWVVKEIRKVGGMVSNLAGNRPLFRVIWGGSRWATAPDGMTLIRPYRVDMWHLEKLHEGEYEHCYRIGECTHRKNKTEPFCRKCFLDGGTPMEPDQCWSFIEGLIHLILKTEEMQKRARNNDAARTAQRDALIGREAEKKVGREEIVQEAMADAMPKTMKRTFETPIRLSAEQALGTRKGLRQLDAREIVQGLRQRSK